MAAQIERALQQEIMLRLKRYPIVVAAIPNGIYLPSRDPAEREVIKRIIARMKNDGMLTPGAGDLVLVGAKGAKFIECKRPKTSDLFTTRPKGRLSDEQKDFRRLCMNAGVEYVVAYCWQDVECSLDGLF